MSIKVHLKRMWPAFMTLVLLLLIWQAATVFWSIPNWLLPAPSRIVTAMWMWRQILFRDIAITVSETVLGFLAALLIAVPLAALLVSSNLIWRALYPLLSAVQSIPKNALAPLLILWFGTGQFSKVVIAFLICFFPIVINALSGMILIDADALDMVKSLRANRWQIFWYFRLPNALPYIFAASKVAITLALVGAVIGEFVGADSGLGYLILISSSQLQTDLAFVAIVLLALIGMALFSLIGAIERRAMPWCTPSDGEPVGEMT
jgi:ABC-type nitrate/sulfonate/bicarbonate transport system permease component